MIYFKLFNFSISPSSILGRFALTIIIGDLIISSRLEAPTCDIGIMHGPCHDPRGPSGGGGGGWGLASTTQGGIDAP